MTYRCVSPLRILLVLAALGTGVAALPSAQEKPARAAAARTVYLVGKLAEEDLIAFLSGVAATEPESVVLLETPATAEHLKSFLTQYRADRITSVGTFADTLSARQN